MDVEQVTPLGGDLYVFIWMVICSTWIRTNGLLMIVYSVMVYIAEFDGTETCQFQLFTC